MWLLTICLLIVCACLAYPFYKKYEIQERIKKFQAETQKFVEEINRRKGLQPIQLSGIFLEEGEKAYLSKPSALLETRSVRKSSGTGGGVRVMKGVYIGQYGSTSRSHQELQKIDSGTLIVTNKRLIFDGERENRSFPLTKIFSISTSADSIEVSVHGKSKSMLFTSQNPLLLTVILGIVKNNKDPEQLKDTLSINTQLA